MPKRAILYARVSTDEQANNYSLPTQLEACRAYAQQHGFQVIEEITDDCSGSIPVMARPGGGKVYDYLNANSIAAVIMYTIDRSARDKREYPIEFMIFLRDVQDAGAELHFVDTGKSDGGIIDMFRAWQASEERRKIRERSTRGRRARAASGKWIGSSVTPYGYRRVGRGRESTLEIDPIEGAVVQRIFELYTGATGEHYTLRELARQLDDEGVAPPNRHHQGKGWYIYTLKVILQREAYLGKFEYAGIPIELPALALVEPDVWAAAQEQLRFNRERAARNRKRQYLLSGCVFCSCGRRRRGAGFKSSSKGVFYLYYICTRNKEVCESCASRHIRADWLDAVVWEWLDGLLRDEERLNQKLDEIEQLQAAQQEPQQRRLATVTASLDKAIRKVERLARAFGDADDDMLADVLKAQLREATQEKQTLETVRDEVEAELQQTLTAEKRATIRQTAANIRLGINDPDFATKREVVTALNVQVFVLDEGNDEVEGGQRGVRITCEFGGSSVLRIDNLWYHLG
jgi:site-specific DNA recombinase